jgi:hypothetical protein
MIRYTIPSSEEDRTATYLIETAVHTAKGQAQGIVFFFNSVVTHVCSSLYFDLWLLLGGEIFCETMSVSSFTLSCGCCNSCYSGEIFVQAFGLWLVIF